MYLKFQILGPTPRRELEADLVVTTDDRRLLEILESPDYSGDEVVAVNVTDTVGRLDLPRDEWEFHLQASFKVPFYPEA